MGAHGWSAIWTRDARAEAVEADIRAELEAHLELSEEALRGQGRTHDEARAEARARFGDLERTLRACRRVQLGGRLMLVRVQWILIALLTSSTLALALYGREAVVRAELARAEAAALGEALSSRPSGPVEQIVLGVGDRLDVQSDLVADLSQTTEVQLDGQALFRHVGWLPVAGKTRPEVEALLAERYAMYYEPLGPVYVIVKSAD